LCIEKTIFAVCSFVGRWTVCGAGILAGVARISVLQVLPIVRQALRPCGMVAGPLTLVAFPAAMAVAVKVLLRELG